jgi:hypothetical protein
MENHVKIRLTEETFARLQQAALAEGLTPIELATAELERHFGGMGKSNATVVDKPQVDANLD